MIKMENTLENGRQERNMMEEMRGNLNSSGTQTSPTKGRPKEIAKELKTQIDWGNPELGLPLYTEGPYIRHLTEMITTILRRNLIPTKIVHKLPTNQLFSNTKDDIPMMERGKSIFSMTNAWKNNS